MKSLYLLPFALLSFNAAQAAEPAAKEPYGIGLEGFAYPYPVNMLPLTNEGEQVRMAYMDIAPATPNGRTVLNVGHLVFLEAETKFNELMLGFLAK